MSNPKNKTYASTFIYSKKDESGHDTELALVKFIKFAQRVNRSSDAFKAIQNEVKVRQKTAVLYRVLMMDDVVLCMNDKELPASFKVFEAKDIAMGNAAPRPKVFIDVTGLFKLEKGYYVCKEIDKLCAYLIDALIYLLYHGNTARLTTNTAVIKTSAVCFAKLFVNVFDNLRVIGFSENRTKITYIAAVYYLYNIMQKDIASAQKTATSILSMNMKDTYAFDYYYQYNTDFADINAFITFLTETFKLKGMTTDVFISRWIMLYGKGTMYGLELLPSFLTIIANAYSGAYVNNQKTIELICSREMVDLTTTILRIGADNYDKGFRYESAMQRSDLAEFGTRPVE